MSPGWINENRAVRGVDFHRCGLAVESGEGAGAHANRALRQPELGDVVGERRERDIRAIAQADREARGLQLAKGVVVSVNTVSAGEGIVDLGLGEGVDAVWLERDVALDHRDASDPVGWVAVIVLRIKQRGGAEEKDAQ